MTTTLKPASTWPPDRTPVVNSTTGLVNWDWLHFFLGIATSTQNGLTPLGQVIGNIAFTATVGDRTEGIGVDLQNIDNNGVLTAEGIDFSRAYINKTTDYITDGTGHPLAGGKAAYQALIVAPPVAVPHEWINGFNTVTGDFTLSQPAFTDISGTATPSQLPVATSSSLGIVQPDNSTITISAGVISAVAGGAHYADAETPSGLINGSNVTYTLAHTPNPALSLILSLAGQIQAQGVGLDYTLSGTTVTFTTAPGLGPLLAWYRY